MKSHAVYHALCVPAALVDLPQPTLKKAENCGIVACGAQIEAALGPFWLKTLSQRLELPRGGRACTPVHTARSASSMAPTECARLSVSHAYLQCVSPCQFAIAEAESQAPRYITRPFWTGPRPSVRTGPPAEPKEARNAHTCTSLPWLECPASLQTMAAVLRLTPCFQERAP